MNPPDQNTGSLLYQYPESIHGLIMHRKILGFIFISSGILAWFISIFFYNDIVSIFTIVVLFTMGSIFPIVGVVLIVDKIYPLRIYENGILFTDTTYWPYTSIYDIKKGNNFSLDIKHVAGKKYTISASWTEMRPAEWQKMYDIITTKFTAMKKKG